MSSDDLTNGPMTQDAGSGLTPEQAEPIRVTSFSVTYDRTFHTGDCERLTPAVTVWVKRVMPDGVTFDLHHARERVRRMARENVRAQLLRLQGSPEVVFLGLQPPFTGATDPIVVHTVSLSLIRSVNLGEKNSLTIGYADWAELHQLASRPSELHIALARLWQSLWANVEDEVARAQGKGSAGGFFGLPPNSAEAVPGSRVTATGRVSEVAPAHSVTGGGFLWIP